MTKRERPLVEQLRQAMTEFDRAIRTLEIAFDRAKNIDLAAPSIDDEIVLEAFTSRFARAADLHLQRVIRTIDALELIEKDTLIDVLNRAEKRGLIPNAAIFRDIRSLRNDITHDYSIEDLPPIYRGAITLAPHLIATLAPTKKYSDGLIAKLG